MSTLAIILIILLIISFIPNAYVLYKSNKAGNVNPRVKLMVGIDAMLVILIVAALFFLT
ncbi:MULTISPECIES: hypothetical protein [unclassified Staphylococcus]|uniref:hypothetical protein n=1 Tax=unclassified Staphylococcus TaxID=91994 RepID=UPI0021D0859E|nr:MULTISPECIES: hypothetical protein [unclassified Staphylococcus]UXR69323.1 hypothetical protein MUA26_09380 [Staphylococcus sp. IVB6246]UXR71376.1 hypothetical protein MUA88_09400 [Staphylococcus sp. IVB6240]UXR73654.1 hypothetical protein MUA48_09900 [Staphylococcus sp. IVB6238]UXR75971.1 hypothetical protein MUA74_09985 [Staphylococcus sp. IVB6233]UXR80168.1 hypothetical protein MUA65_09590 [Staphylococcus sp. IVB6218]